MESIWDGLDLRVLGVAPGAYQLIVQDSRACSISLAVELLGPEEISVVATVGNPGCEGSLDGVLELDIAGGRGPYAVFWDSGQIGSRIDLLPYGEFGYTFTYANGCVATGVAVVNQARPEVRMPTGFDPRDGVYQPVSNCSISYEISIWDRWGGVIYFGSEGWNGLVNGMAAPANSFYYLIRYDYLLDGLETSSEKRGSFVLIRSVFHVSFWNIWIVLPEKLFTDMKKILITGGAGYIGSHTAVELWNAGMEPIILDDLSNSEAKVVDRLEEITGKRFAFYEGDCNDKSMLDAIAKDHQLEGVIHFAAFKAVGESTAKPLKYYKNNIGSLVVLLEFLQEQGIKDLVFSSSCTVYGQPEVLPVTEATPRQEAESPYGNTKKICEDILIDFVKSKPGMRVVALRYFNPVGAHPSAKIGELPLGTPNNLVPFITQVAAGIREKLTVFGDDYDTSDGSCVRDYIHVVDLADAHVKAFSYLNQQPDNFYDVFNVGTGNGNTVLEVIHSFEKVSGEKLNYVIGPRRAGDVVKTWADTTKIRQVLGWTPQYSLDDSMRDSWNWQKGLK